MCEQTIREEPRQVGKWLRDEVPKYGWHCVRMVDRDDDESDGFLFGEYCEMCEVTPRRYIHVMRHPQYPRELGCGCVCAGYMTDNVAQARFREEQFKVRRELRTKPDTDHFRRKGWHHHYYDWSRTHVLTPSSRWPSAVQAWRFEVRVEEYDDVGWIGLVHYRYHIVDGTDPSDDWRIAALDAAEIVEQRMSDEAWLADQNAKTEIREEERRQRDLAKYAESLKRLQISEEERREKLAFAASPLGSLRGE